MILDFVEKTGAFVLKVPRSNSDLVQSLMQDHGLDFSVTASTPQEAVLFTREPYAAASFADHATQRARNKMGGILAEIAASWRATSKTDYSRFVPDGKELWDFQRADLDYALRRRHCLIADQPGLGKTPVGITYANAIGARHALVICPASIRLQWLRRISEWTTMRWPYYMHAVTTKRKGVFPTQPDGCGWNVVSYDLARQPEIGAALARNKYDVVILDEAHYLKTIDSKRTRAIFGGGRDHSFEPIANQADHVLGLTGTPLPNRPREAYTLARALHFDSIDWLSEDGFKERFNPSMLMEGERADGSTYRYVDERSGRHGELQNRLRANFMVRHLKRDVMPQLKLPVYDLIQLEESGAIKAALKAESLLDIDPENLTGADAETLGHVATVRMQMGIAMAPGVADYVDMLIRGGEWKLVIFAWHIEVLNILEERFQRYGVVRIDGSTGAVRKQKLVDKFVEDGDIGVCLGNMLSMGVGTDGLQAVASHGLIAEPDWVPGNNLQAFDRLDRGGQRQQVQADIFVVPGSFAERVLASALRKLNVTHAALDRRVLEGAF